MPFTGSSFRQRHNHGLTAAQGAHAASIANAIMRRGEPEGIAIATANKRARSNGYADGGPTGTGIAAIDPTASNMANPFMAQQMQRFAALPAEKLQELAVRTRGSPYGALIQRVLAQKQMMPQSVQAAPIAPPQDQQGAAPGAMRNGGYITSDNPGWQPRWPLLALTGSGLQDRINEASGPEELSDIAQHLTFYGMHVPPALAPYRASGGRLRGYAGGGAPMGVPMSMGSPWWERGELYNTERADTGFLHSAVPGRTDKINVSPPAGSYVLPADVVSGIGEGNSLAGARFLSAALSSGPYGTPMPRGARGRGPPSPPRPSAAMYEAKGGHVERRPIVAAGGEFIVSPEQVRAIGGGSEKRGQDILDKFVLHIRKRTIKEMGSLKGPKS